MKELNNVTDWIEQLINRHKSNYYDVTFAELFEKLKEKK
jgi:hypothetical protein